MEYQPSSGVILKIRLITFIKEQIATSTDVLDARNFLTQADTNYFRSMYGYLSAVAALERAVGRRIE